MNYQDLVARAIAVKAADLEMGLSRAREQRPFVESVSRVLDGMAAAYAVRMDRDFKTVFNVEIGRDYNDTVAAVRRELAARFDVESRDGDALAVHSREPQGFSCRVVFGDVPF